MYVVFGREGFMDHAFHKEADADNHLAQLILEDDADEDDYYVESVSIT